MPADTATAPPSGSCASSSAACPAWIPAIPATGDCATHVTPTYAEVGIADDALLGFTGPKAEAEEIKARLAQFLRDDLKLELGKEKTLITHVSTQAAKFLGYEITVAHDDRRVTGGIRRLDGTVQLRVPKTVIKAERAPYLQRGKPAWSAR